MIRVHLDFETASPQSLDAGVYKYAEDVHTRVWGFAYRFGHEEVQNWYPQFPIPERLLNHICDGGLIVAHNAQFERIIWNQVILRLFPDWPSLMIGQMRCTMAKALAYGLPAGLDDVATVLGCLHTKDKAGRALMMKMCRPKGVDVFGNYTWHDDPKDIEYLIGTYCVKDVLAETDVDDKLPDLSPTAQDTWEYDQIINDRGIAIDYQLVERAVALSDIAKKRADAEMRQVTGGAVSKCTEVQGLIRYLNSRGINCEAMQKHELDGYLDLADLIGDDKVRKAVELRKATSKTSASKYSKMLDCAGRDHRVRGALQYHGARTGRWAGRLIQPQNFTRFDGSKPKEAKPVLRLIELLHSGESIIKVHHTLEREYGSIMPILAKALRGSLIAQHENYFVGGDFANIEGRGNAWLAGESWKIDAFRAYDAGTGNDLYKVAYAKAFNILLEQVDGGADSGPQRQIGKVMELACGYQGGVGAFIKMGATYGVRPEELAKAIYEAVSAEIWDETAVQYEKATDKCGLGEREWTAIKIIVKGWRSAHPRIVQSWWDYQEAALNAVTLPGEIVLVQNGNIPISYACDPNRQYLYCWLPSGRHIAYALPHVKSSEVTRVNKKGEEYTRWESHVHFFGVDSKTRQWKQLSLYGGLQCENITQAICADIMIEAMKRVESAGFPVVLTVHDELLSECFNPDEKLYKALMSKVPTWAYGLPLAVKTFTDKRYVK